jgi:hypothetical protein
MLFRQGTASSAGTTLIDQEYLNEVQYDKDYSFLG